jgi:alcohol dehydrogenase class IV
MSMAENRTEPAGLAVAAFRAPPLVQVGWGALRASLPSVLAEAAVGRPLLVTDPIVRNLPVVVEAVEAVAPVVPFAATFDQIPGEPTTREVEAGADLLSAANADGVVAIGGGAVIDTAKAIVMLAANGGPLPGYMGVNRFPRPGLPLIAAPTTAGTGSEVTRFTVITDPDTRVKMLITDDKMVARAAIVDPSLTVDAPPRVTASAGVDALTHAVEAYVSRRATPLTDTLALAAIRRLTWSLPAAFADGGDTAARTAAAIAALEAGLAFSNASVALVHGMSRPLGAVFGVPHGIANAMLLPVVMEYSLDAAPARYRVVADALGVGTEGLDDRSAARRGLDAVRSLCQRLGIPSLTGYGIARADLERAAAKMAQDALASGSPANNPRVPTADEVVELYLRAA